jgi:ABC-type polysaccharide/polyol phosphate transport system ATPase subunit
MSLFSACRILYSTIIFTLILQSSLSLQLNPSRVRFTDVTQSYEDTLLRRLFSSIPRRDFALNSVSFEVQSGSILVILGASSSGKSTILRLVHGREKPVSGSILLESTSIPVYLDRKPEYNDRLTIKSILLQRFEGGAFGVSICEIISLDIDKKPSDLSPSETYKFGLVVACMESVSVREPCAPILLLDEWMDLETSIVVHKVEKAMLELTEGIGAIILYVTHKPNLLGASHECMTLCRGEILSRGRTR